jgi:phage/plasmid-associated DNA primase
MDALQEWLSERCVADAKEITPFKELYDDYVAWCTETDQEPLGKRAFANRLTEKGFDAVKATGGTRARRGLQLRPTSGLSSGASGSSGSTSDILPKKSLYMGKISKPEPTEPLKPLDEPLDDEDCPF